MVRGPFGARGVNFEPFLTILTILLHFESFWIILAPGPKCVARATDADAPAKADVSADASAEADADALTENALTENYHLRARGLN